MEHKIILSCGSYNTVPVQQYYKSIHLFFWNSVVQGEGGGGLRSEART